MEESTQRYEIKTSRNGLSVPVINGIHLHSIYNPMKEAEAFAEGYENVVKEKSTILVLGLGYGYHIEQIARIANKNHNDYKIVIIEPNTELAIDFNNNRPFEDKNILIFNASTPSKLFEDTEFVDFLKTKPAIIKHDTSFALEKKFYVDFLKYQAPTHIDKYFYMLNKNSQTICEPYLETNNTITDIANNIKTKTGIQHKNDFLILALNEIKNTFSEQSRGA